MTDVEAESFLIRTFEEIPEFNQEPNPILTKSIKNGKTIITNINYENRAFTRPDNGYWFRLSFLPVKQNEAGIGMSSCNRFRGILQVDIVVPKDSGTTARNARYNAIFKAFSRGFITNGIRILSVGRSSARSCGDYCSLPISIAYEAYFPKRS